MREIAARSGHFPVPVEAFPASEMNHRAPNFGVGGFPPAFLKGAAGKDRSAIFAWLASLGLNALELQMTRGANMPIHTCRLYRQLAADHGIRLSIHGSYYIVLNSPDSAKYRRSTESLLRTFELADELGVREIVIHPGSLYGQDEEEAAKRFVDGVGAFMVQLGCSETGLFIETAGKVGQLGSVEAILDMASQVDGVEPCIDFGHVHARTLGGLRETGAIAALGSRLVEFATRWPTKRFHFHYTPIHYGLRGEIQHRALSDRGPLGNSGRSEPFHPRPEPVAEMLRRIPSRFTAISETLDSQEEGGLALQTLCLHEAKGEPTATPIDSIQSPRF